MYLLNSFSGSMLPDCYHSRGEFETLTLDEAKSYLASYGLDSCIGHDDTASLFSSLLGRKVPCVRKSITLYTGDTAILGQYKGPRLPEGTTRLPEGATIIWYKISMY